MTETSLTPQEAHWREDVFAATADFLALLDPLYAGSGADLGVAKEYVAPIRELVCFLNTEIDRVETGVTITAPRSTLPDLLPFMLEETPPDERKA